MVLTVQRRPKGTALRICLAAATLMAVVNNPVGAAESGVEAGKRLVAQHACASCHSFGSGAGGMVGPNLNQVILRRSRQWLLSWLDNPSAIKPGTLMPKFVWKPGEREAVVDYLATFAKPVDAAAIIRRGGTGKNAGEALVRAYQCFACHKVAGEEGRALYPDLTTVAKRRTSDWERKWLTDPQAVKPGTFMPNFHLSSQAIDAIVAYLYQ